MQHSGNSYRSIFKAISLFASVQGLNILLNLVRSKLAAVLLGPAGIGLNSIYNETREFIHVTTNLGMDASGVREIASVYGHKDEEDDKACLQETIKLTRSWGLVLAFLGFLITFVLARPLSLLTFSDTQHTIDYMLLSFAVAFSTLTCSEMIILKGIHRLKTVALVSVLHVIVGIVTTIPLFYIYGMDGIIASLILMTFCLTIVTMSYSYRIYKPGFCFSSVFLSKGKAMLLLGLSFVLSGFIAESSKIGIQAFVNNKGSLDMVGLYSAGYSLMISCGKVVFASMESDFFPRLSSIFTDPKERSIAVNRQMEMGLYLILPVCVMAIFGMPIIVPLLFSSEFQQVVPMAQIAIAGLIFRAIFLPAALVPMAAGESKFYLLLQSISYISFVPAILIGFCYYGITGAGVGLFINQAFDALVNTSVNHWRYNIVTSSKIWMFLVIFLSVILFCYAMAQVLCGGLYVATGICLSIACCGISYTLIRKSVKYESA